MINNKPGQDPKTMRKYVKFRIKKTGELADMNWWEWLAKNPKGPGKEKDEFEFVDIVDLDAGQPVREASVEFPKDIPAIQEDSLQCPLCGGVYKTPTALKAHKTRKHG